jgi:MFS family permease
VAAEQTNPDQTTEDQDKLEQQARGFGVLRFRNYRLFFGGQLVSTTGMWMQSLAQSWLVVDILDASAFQLGLVPIFQFGPSLIAGIPAGTLIDRFPKKTMLLCTQVVYMMLAFFLAILTWTGNVELWHVYATGFAFGLTGALDMPARQAFVSELVPKYALKNAIAINSATFNMGRIMGPAIAGVVLAAFGVAACFFINAFSYFGPIIALLAMKLAPQAKRSAASGWDQMKEGIAYVRSTSAIRWPMVLVMVVGCFGMAYNVWLPLLATEGFNADEGMFGVMFSAMGFGSLLGALGVAYSRGGPSRARMLAAAIMLGVVTFSIGVIAVIPLSIWLATAALTLSGFCASTTMALANTIVQTTASDELRGRVMAVYSTVFMGTMPLAGLIAGAISNRWNIEVSMFVGGGIVAIVAALMFMRHLRSPQPVGSAAIHVG